MGENVNLGLQVVKSYALFGRQRNLEWIGLGVER